MQKRVIYRTVLGLIAGLILISQAPTALAQDEAVEGIMLSPVNKRYTVDAGSTKSDSFKIYNTGQTPYDFVVYARPYAIIDSDYNNPNYADAANRVANADAYKWAQFDKASYHLGPGESAEVPFTLRIPADATPGGHYGVLFASTQSDQPNDVGVSRVKRVGLVVYATVKGDYTTGAVVAQPEVPFFQLNPPLTASASVQNTGNADFLANVSYRVTDVFGNQKYYEQKDYAVLPGTTRAIYEQWAGANWFGLYQTEVSVKALDRDIYKKTYVLMAPFWFYGIVAILLIGGIWYAVARRRR